MSEIKCTIPCNLCGSKSIDILSLKDRKGGYLRNVICKNCGLIWIDPRPSDEDIQKFYSTEYRKEYKGITTPKKKHVYRDAKESIRRYFFFKDFLNKNDSILDIGAGNGIFVYCLNQLGINAKGIGSDENHALYARETLNVSVITGFARDINEKDSFNIVTLHHVLEHMTDPLAEMKNIWSILKESGYLILEVPNAEDLKQDPGNRYHKAHLFTFNPETVIALGKSAGFKVIRKNIAPLNGNISIIFQKSHEAENNLKSLGNNYLKIKAVLNRHGNFRHFTSITPYRKLIENLFEAIREQIAIRQFQSDKDIIDMLISFDRHSVA